MTRPNGTQLNHDRRTPRRCDVVRNQVMTIKTKHAFWAYPNFTDNTLVNHNLNANISIRVFHFLMRSLVCDASDAEFTEVGSGNAKIIVATLVLIKDALKTVMGAIREMVSPNVNDPLPENVTFAEKNLLAFPTFPQHLSTRLHSSSGVGDALLYLCVATDDR